MKILIACEFSGIVRTAFNTLGHDAVSCDLLDSDIPGQHYKGDVADILNDGWDMMIAHPPCTRLANCNVRWLYERNLWDELERAREFFMILYNAPIEKICIENPIPHKYGRLPRYTQIIQPWQHGHGETKGTCLWLKNLPNLKPSNIVDGREHRIHKMSPSADRGKKRSITYIGIAQAMADQWGV